MSYESCYKIYYNEKEDYVTVVFVKSYYDDSYNENYFFKDDEGDILKFEWEHEAIEWLRDNVLDDKIDPKYINKWFNQNKFMK